MTKVLREKTSSNLRLYVKDVPTHLRSRRPDIFSIRYIWVGPVSFKSGPVKNEPFNLALFEYSVTQKCIGKRRDVSYGRMANGQCQVILFMYPVIREDMDENASVRWDLHEI
jgi:hypothetical protein